MCCSRPSSADWRNQPDRSEDAALISLMKSDVCVCFGCSDAPGNRGKSHNLFGGQILITVRHQRDGRILIGGEASDCHLERVSDSQLIKFDGESVKGRRTGSSAAAMIN